MASQMLQKSTTSVVWQAKCCKSPLRRSTNLTTSGVTLTTSGVTHDVVTHKLQRREYTRRRQRTPKTSGVLRAFRNVVSAT
jgi:hypothetical protein